LSTLCVNSSIEDPTDHACLALLSGVYFAEGKFMKGEKEVVPRRVV